MVMDPKMKNSRQNINAVKKILIQENTFITNLFSMLPIPTSALPVEDEDENEVQNSKKKTEQLVGQKTRAQTLTELQDRLTNMQSKKKLNYKEKLLKKGLKNRLKKKTKLEERHMKKKLVRMEKLKQNQIKLETNESSSVETKPAKPIFNKEGKMVFSKFDFTGIGEKRFEKKNKKDPKEILKNLEMQKAKLNELVDKGEKEKATEIKEKLAWKNAIAKVEGEKVKDDPYLLKKSIKKQEQIKKVHTKKWQERTEGVKKFKEARQTKRQENLNKRKNEKKTKKLKQAAKRGRIVPGF